MSQPISSDSSSVLRVAIAGLGTVGAGVAKLLAANADLIKARTGRAVELVAVSSRTKSKDRGIDLSDVTWYDNPLDFLNDRRIDVIVETIGGTDGVALALCTQGLEKGYHIVTANKALIATHGADLAARADEKNLALACEAAVAGGIPIIKGLKEGLCGNRVSRVMGIMNGTGNYMLTRMERTGESFETILVDAQAKGYAEADPSFDVDGIDTAHKLAILTSIAFGVTPDFDAVHCEGIRDVASVDIACANELGYKIKLLGIAHRGASGIEQTVYPALIKHNHPLATIGDVQNAVAIEAEPVGSVMLTGPGAGEGPTASSVVSDICDIARNLILPTFGQKMSSLNTMQSRSIDAHEGGYYIRLHVEDQPGVLARISDCLSDQSISIESIIQKPCDQGSAYVVVLTHLTNEVAMQASLAALKALPAVREIPLMLRVA